MHVVFCLPGNESLTASLIERLGATPGELVMRRFPDGETYVRVDTRVRDRTCVLACGLDRPDAKSLPLYLTAMTLRELGAKRVLLVAPYLAYMRQDVAFHEGESVSARHFAAWISSCVDAIATVDPHLHRFHGLAEIYRVPSRVVTAAPAIGRWIQEQVPDAVLIGPDAESEQWVSSVAHQAARPYVVLEKRRYGDRNVETSVPQVDRWRDHVPVLIDDIISTAGTMIETVGHLRRAGMKPPLCIGVHAIFAGNAYADLEASGVTRILTCNTIPHASNTIDVRDRIGDAVESLLSELGERQSRRQ